MRVGSDINLDASVTLTTPRLHRNIADVWFGLVWFSNAISL
jgi:hypothetical protein